MAAAPHVDRQRLRHELQVHAGAGLESGLPLRSGTDGRQCGCANVVLQETRLVKVIFGQASAAFRLRDQSPSQKGAQIRPRLLLRPIAEAC